MTAFIGVSFSVLDGKLCAIGTSTGYGVADLKGLSTRTCLAFLWSLSYVRDKAALVAFDSAVDCELLVKDLTALQKDSLFGILREKEEKAKDTPLYEPAPIGGKEITEALGYRLSMLPGKIIRIARSKRRGLAVFDIEGFFACGGLADTCARFLGETVPVLEKNMLELWGPAVESAMLDRCILEAGYIVKLAEKVDSIVEPLDLKMRQWYGPSAIAARCLNKWGARKEAKRLHEKNTNQELLKAIDCAYIGGRVEAVKLGTIKNVRVYDLNSAYAYAVTLLSKFYRPLRFTRKYADQHSAPFSVWLVDYDLPQSVSLGVLPTRAPNGSISFRARGRGYFWQPEVDYLRQRYPDSFRVRWGYVGPYDPVSFGVNVEDLYSYRMELKAIDDPGESIVKLALSNLYGKFAQNTGSAHFQCRAWAGWITSLIRRLLLEAVTGVEDSVICFCQDAVHLAGQDATVDLGQGLGQWKRAQYDRGFYTAPGLYDLVNDQDGVAKSASRGVNARIDWQAVATALSERQIAELERSFYCGWRLARVAPIVYGTRYLSEVHESLSLIPSRLKARNYMSAFDWAEENRGSTINRNFSGQLSARYVPQEQSAAALRVKLKERGWV